MTLSITVDRMTGNATPHTATGFPDGWRVTWLGDRTVDYNLAVTAMMLADEVGRLALWVGSSVTIPAYAAELGLAAADAIRMVRETLPSTPVEVEPEQSAEAERDAKRARLAALADSDCERCDGSGLDPDTFTTTKRADGQAIIHLTEPCRDCIDEDDLTDKKLVPCPYCGALVEPEVAAAMVRLREAADRDEPAKTHDLTVQRVGGGHLSPNVVITVGDGTDEHDVYLPAGVALDLGRVLAPLTPAQRQLLVDDLTGGEN